MITLGNCVVECSGCDTQCVNTEIGYLCPKCGRYMIEFKSLKEGTNVMTEATRKTPVAHVDVLIVDLRLAVKIDVRR